MKKFLVSTADVYGYNDKDDLLFVGKTLLDSTIDVTLGSTKVNAGKGNKLQYVYYHTAEMNITINEAQFSLDFLALNSGSSIETGADMFIEETVDITNGQGTVTKGTPLVLETSTIYGWVSKPDGTVSRATFTGSSFDMAQSYTGTACIRYYTNVTSARSVVINAEMIPSTIRLVLDAQLCSSDATTNKIGKVEIEVPKASMTGQFTLNMTPDGTSSTPLSAIALASEVSGSGCDGAQSIYAKITEYVESSNWYDNVVALAIEGGDFTIGSGATKTLKVYAIPTNGSAFMAPITGVTFSTEDTGHITVTSAGVVTGVSATTEPVNVSVTINSKTNIDATVFVTVTA